MPSTNSRGPKRAKLYTRVSGEEEQKKKSYSLTAQLDALRRWAKREGYEGLEEVKDSGYSGSHLERQDLDGVRNLVAGPSDPPLRTSLAIWTWLGLVYT